MFCVHACVCSIIIQVCVRAYVYVYILVQVCKENDIKSFTNVCFAIITVTHLD